MLAAHGWDVAVRRALEALSAPFNPWIDWRVPDALWPVKFPVNSTEINFIAALSAVLLYVVVSLLTCKKPFDLERMLHRGRWADEEPEGERSQISNVPKSALSANKNLCASAPLRERKSSFCLNDLLSVLHLPFVLPQRELATDVAFGNAKKLRDLFRSEEHTSELQSQ